MIQTYIEVVAQNTPWSLERSILSAPVAFSPVVVDLLRGVLGKRQVTPVWRMWYATRPDQPV